MDRCRRRKPCRRALIDNDDLVRFHRGRDFESMRDRMGRFERRDDSLNAGEAEERRERLIIGRVIILHAARSR